MKNDASSAPHSATLHQQIRAERSPSGSISRVLWAFAFAAAGRLAVYWLDLPLDFMPLFGLLFVGGTIHAATQQIAYESQRRHEDANQINETLEHIWFDLKK